MSPSRRFLALPALAFVSSFLVPIGVPGAASAATWVCDTLLETGGGNMNLTITIDDGADTIDFLLTGPDAQWMAIGPGGNVMFNRYAIVTYPAGTAEERKLGNHNAGAALSPQNITLDSFTPNGDGTNTFAISRDRDPGDPDAYVFPMAEVEAGNWIPMIWAVGQGASFAYHGGSNKNIGSVQFSGPPVAVGEPSVRDLSWGQVKLAFRRVD